MKRNLSLNIKRFLAVIFLLFSTPCVFASSTEIQRSLLTDIKKAEQNLSATQASLSNKRQQMSQRLNTLEREVLKLREKTAVARRLTDENTLSLSQLEQRLDTWRQQHAYQQNLLARFIRQHHSTMVNDSKPLHSQIDAVTQLTNTLQSRLYLGWQNKDVVTESGEIQEMATLTVGPVTWYLQENENRAGLANVKDGIIKTGLPLSGSDRRNLEKLAEQGTGYIIFDPSLSRAIAKAQNTESPIEHIAKGGLWAIPILLFALFAISIALLKSVQLWRLDKIVLLSPKQLLSMSSQVPPVSIGGMQKRLLEIGINEKKGQLRDDRLFTELQADKHWLERWIGAIAITASVSPLLGLLGTVSGMIETFKMMTLFGSGDPEVVSGGIAQALVTTELGLVVAIPALILNAVLSRRAKSYYSQLETFAIQLSQLEEPDFISSTSQKTFSEEIFEVPA